MTISNFCIRRPVFTLMLIGALVVFGLTAYRSLGVSLFPDVDFPIVTVSVVYEGADPETVETEVTDVIEEAVNTISGIKSLRSESAEGISMVFIEFQLDRNIDVASQDVRDKVAGIRAELPTEIEAPVVEKFDPDSAPILSIVLSGPTSIRELTRMADDVIKPQIEGIEGVGSVKLVGGRDREVRVWLRVDDLRTYGLAAPDVIDALRRENIEYPGGRVESENREVVIKTLGEMETVRQFEEIVIAYREGAPIRVRDVASVEDGQEDFRSLSRLNGQLAVSLLVRRQSGENLLTVADGVKAQLDEVRASLPTGYQLVLAQDLSIFVANSFNDTQGELLRGSFLAVLVILIFLRNPRGAFVAAVTIPTTIVATFTFINVMDFTLNMMSMLALSISVGMVIDDSIVVLENSFRHMEEGKSRVQAALAGISEIGFAVIATSLAIVAVFIPVAFMDGLVGQFFYEFGMTVTFAVIISTFIAVTLSPMLCSQVLKLPKKHGLIFTAMENFFVGLESAYRWALTAALRFRTITVLAAIGIFVASLMLTGLIGKEFVASQDEAQFNVQVETPLGSSIHRTSKLLETIEHRMKDLPGVTDVFSTVGAGAEGRVTNATVLVKMTPKAKRQLSQQDVMFMARERLADLGECDISIEDIPRVSGGGMRSSPIQFNLRGPDLATLDELSKKVVDDMNKVGGIVDLNTSYDPEKPEISVIIDRERAADLGVSARDLGSTIRALVGGQEVTSFKEGGESYDVRMRLVASDRTGRDAAYSLPVRGRNGLVELRSLVDVHDGTGPVQIDRQARQRQITVFANLEKNKPLGEAVGDIEQIVGNMELPAGVKTAFTGEADMMAETFANILFSMMLAIILIYMILAAQFESLIHPFTVMLSLPLSVGGALGALALTGRTLNIFSMIGMIMLMGLVTKNAILLVEYTNQLRGRGMGKTDALLKAGPVRLRPILMTAFSTIAGMIPIAIGLGEGAESRAPMGTCVVGGMVTSTLLTLIVIPVMYSLLDDFGVWLKSWMPSDDESDPSDTPPEEPVQLSDDRTLRIGNEETLSPTPAVVAAKRVSC
jgi:hydrophobic/amphiphilic exporter-1 (mainly G- bacteria), HAE1 family